MAMTLPAIAGLISTIMFAVSTWPMLRKAFRTKDLKSYSLGYLLLGNVGNIVYSIYVFDMPPGPIWLLHSFYLVATGLMLFWYLRYEWWPEFQQRQRHRPGLRVQKRSRSARGHPTVTSYGETDASQSRA